MPKLFLKKNSYLLRCYSFLVNVDGIFLQSIFSTITTTSYEDEEDQNEETSKNVSLSTYFKYFSSGMNVCPFMTIIVIFVMCQIVLNASDMWIKQW